MFKKILLIFTLLLPFYAFSGTQTGKVAWIVVRASDGLVYFGIEGSPASGKPVDVVGMNSCKRWGDGEDVNTIKIK